ncbi:hypothetical protein NDU88_009502 [Pleurodeles waltl]|uniref:Uncharacterized protein n=1 Tax=Pleurodeles waltl TaxID=8319 RepID=A0AAV7S0M3_PLEWA|nr:hypothetical protein NDU88_009502 [Pleurodeles waltl]
MSCVPWAGACCRRERCAAVRAVRWARSRRPAGSTWERGGARGGGRKWAEKRSPRGEPGTKLGTGAREVAAPSLFAPAAGSPKEDAKRSEVLLCRRALTWRSWQWRIGPGSLVGGSGGPRSPCLKRKRAVGWRSLQRKTNGCWHGCEARRIKSLATTRRGPVESLTPSQ